VCVQCPIWLFSVVPWLRGFPLRCSGIFWMILRQFQLPLLLLGSYLFWHIVVVIIIIIFIFLHNSTGLWRRYTMFKIVFFMGFLHRPVSPITIRAQNEHIIQTGSGTHPASYSKGTGVLSRGKLAVEWNTFVTWTVTICLNRFDDEQSL
jgi:hypothetical protein